MNTFNCVVCNKEVSLKDMLNFVSKEDKETSTNEIKFSYQCPKCKAIVEVNIII